MAERSPLGVVLLAEDDDAQRQLMSVMLEDRDYDPRAAADLAEALSTFVPLLSTVSPVAAILDGRLPDGKGADLAHELRLVSPQLPIISYSAEREDQTFGDWNIRKPHYQEVFDILGLIVANPSFVEPIMRHRTEGVISTGINLGRLRENNH